MSAHAYHKLLRDKNRTIVREKAKRINKALAWRERISIYRMRKWVKNK